MRQRGKGYQHIQRVMNLASCGDLKVSKVGATSNLCILGIQTSQPHILHVFGPHASDGGWPLALTHGVIDEMHASSICVPDWSSITLTDNDRG